MSSIFGGAKTPEVRQPDPLPPVPERSDAETAALAEDQRRRAAGRTQGRAATWLSGGNSGQTASSAVRYLGASART